MVVTQTWRAKRMGMTNQYEVKLDSDDVSMLTIYEVIQSFKGREHLHLPLSALGL